MGDRAELEVVVSSQVDRLLSGMSSMERSLVTIEKAHGTAATAAVHQSNALTQLEGHVGSLTARLGALVNIGTGFAIFEALKSGFDAFKGVEQFNIDIAHMTTYLQGNATAASTWMQVSDVMGISVQTIDRAFVKLATDMNAHSNPALQQMGISATSATGKLRPLNDVIMQSADYFHQHAGASNNAALANQLFGRSGYELLPMLEQGRAGLNNITEEARKYGLVLSADAIQRNLQFTYELKSSEMAVRGLGISILNSALPAVAMLAKGIDQLVQQNLPAITAAFERSAFYLAGFISGLTGMSMTLDKSAIDMGKLSTASGDMGTQMGSSSAAADGLAAAQRRLQDQTNATNATFDKQVSALNAQMAATAFMDTQANLKQKSEDEQVNITKLSQDKQLALFLGNAVQARQIDDQLGAAKEQNAQTQLQLTRGVENETIKAKIASLQQQKQDFDAAMQKQVEALRNAGQGGAAAFGAALDTIPPMASKTGKNAGTSLADQMASSAGVQLGQKLQDAIFGQDTVDRFGRHARLGGQGWEAIGGAIGNAMAKGLEIAFGDSLSKIPILGGLGVIIQQAGAALPAAVSNIKIGSGGATYGSDSGGLFTKPTLTWVAESGNPEAIVPLRPGNSAPGASPLPGNDPEVKAILRQILNVLNSINSPSPSGAMAAYQREGR